MTVSDKSKYDCTTCPYPRYKDGLVIFCDVCIRKILDEQKEKKGKERSSRMSNEIKTRPLTPTEQKYTYAQSMQLEGQTGTIGHLRGDFATTGYGFLHHLV